MIQTFGEKIKQGRAIALGNFDGLHLGHQEVLAACNGEFALVSFAPHPKRFFQPELSPFELYTTHATTKQGHDYGASAVHFITFDDALANLSPAEFVDNLFAIFEPSQIVVGADFSFGHKKSGDAATLRALCEAKKIPVTVVPLLEMDGKKISSSRIREALENGEPERATKLLGRPHSLEGVVTKGDQRGRLLGFPTANLYPSDVMLPKFGIYATRLEILTGAKKGQYLGASSLGVRPSFGINKPNFETHILDFDGDIYGETICVHLIAYLRPELKFDGVENLIAQMDQDVIRCREILNA